MTNTQKVLTAAVIGTAAGLVAGMLIAPDKGSEIRRKLSDTTRKTVGNVKDFANTSLSAISDIREKLFGKANGRYEESLTEDHML